MLNKRMEATDPSHPKVMFLTYKAITAALLHFGEVTLNKYRILELYQEHVPDFEGKEFGERVIRNYLGSFYPERPPMKFSGAECAEFVRKLSKLVRS